MSKSRKRVARALAQAGIETDIVALGEARTAAQAAAVAGCAVDQIAKSMIFRGIDSGEALLFLTAGGNRVDAAKAGALAREPLGKADAALVRDRTGFAIGGVAPLGHAHPIRAFIDPRLLEFSHVWAAAGTPHDIFRIATADLLRVTGAEVGDFTS